MGEFFMDTVRSVKEAVLASKRPDLEIHWTEWNTLSAASSSQINWIENVYVDNQNAAALIVRNCISLDNACDSLTYWVASDVFEECALPTQPFRSGYGLLTIHGIPKASYNAFWLLSMMTGSISRATNNTPYPDGTGVCVTWKGGSWRVLIWNAPPLELSDAPSWADTVRLAVDDDSKDYQVLKLRIEPGSGSAYETWLAMGRPTNLTRLEERAIRQHSEPQYVVSTASAADGMVEIAFDLQPYLVEYWEITPREAARTNLSQDTNTTHWNVAMSEVSR
jgi:xylan 1,4-beta-xylosidase